MAPRVKELSALRAASPGRLSAGGRGLAGSHPVFPDSSAPPALLLSFHLRNPSVERFILITMFLKEL